MSATQDSKHTHIIHVCRHGDQPDLEAHTHTPIHHLCTVESLTRAHHLHELLEIDFPIAVLIDFRHHFFQVTFHGVFYSVVT